LSSPTEAAGLWRQLAEVEVEHQLMEVLTLVKDELQEPEGLRAAG
jgi:hypothetical protein